MIIDFHTHIFPDSMAACTINALEKAGGITASTNGTLSGLEASMEQAGIELSLVLPVLTKPSHFQTVNDFAALINREQTGNILSLGGIHPDSEDYRKELEYIHKLGLPGIKIHPDYQKVMIDDPRYLRIIEYADSLGLIIVTHAGIDIGLPDPVHCSPEAAARVLDLIHPEKFVLAHMGGWKQWDQVEEHLAGKKVWLDTSFTFPYLDRETFLRIIKKHGTDRIVFATDSPWGGQAEMVKAIQDLPLSEEDKEKIFWKNAAMLLGRKDL